MADDKKQPIIIKKRKGGHAGAHGGAWKIAYADLVTAMMAFFLVMWIIGMDVQTKQGIATYFQNMSARATHEPASAQIIHMGGAPAVRPLVRPLVPRENNLDKQNAEIVSSQINSLIGSNPQLERLRGAIAVQITDELMRIDFHEGGGQSLFVSDGTQMRPEAKRLIEGVAAILQKNHAKVMIEGHSETRPSGQNGGQGMWEQSTGRAVTVRGVLANAGIGDERILEVKGMGNTKLRIPEDPVNLANRRVSIVMPYDVDQ
jgi:chemotaxis protein MotB